jgi:DNA uptake protein ComE-like DNA-binding protein
VRLKQLALAVLCSGALVAPAFAQSNTVPKPPAPVVTSPSTPTATGLGSTSTTVPTTTSTTGQATSTTTTVPAPTKAMPAPAPAPAPTATAPQTGLTNINTASAAELDKLPQIGKARAAAIIKNRPYKVTDDLLSKKVLSKSVFDKIKDKITT